MNPAKNENCCIVPKQNYVPECLLKKCEPSPQHYFIGYFSTVTSSEVHHSTCYVSSPTYIEIPWPIPLTANLVDSPESIIPDNSSSSQHTNVPTLKQLTSLSKNCNCIQI